MADPLLDRDEFLSPESDEANEVAINATKVEKFIDEVISTINQDLQRTTGDVTAGGVDLQGGDLENARAMTWVDGNGDLVLRLIYETNTDKFLFQDNAGTNAAPIWDTRYEFGIASNGQLFLPDNSGLVFPDGSEINSGLFSPGGFISKLLFQDVDNDSAQWRVEEDANGNLKISHPDLLDENIFFLQDQGKTVIQTESQIGNPGADDRLTPRGYVDSEIANVNHDNIGGVSSADHHSRYTDLEAQNAGVIIGTNTGEFWDEQVTQTIAVDAVETVNAQDVNGYKQGHASLVDPAVIRNGGNLTSSTGVTLNSNGNLNGLKVKHHDPNDNVRNVTVRFSGIVE